MPVYLLLGLIFYFSLYNTLQFVEFSSLEFGSWRASGSIPSCGSKGCGLEVVGHFQCRGVLEQGTDSPNIQSSYPGQFIHPDTSPSIAWVV